MERKNLTQAGLALRLREYGLDARTSTVNEWIRRGALPGGKYLMVLPEILGVSLDELLLQTAAPQTSQILVELVEFTEQMKARYGYGPEEESEEAEEAARALLREARAAVERAEELLTPAPAKQAQAP